MLDTNTQNRQAQNTHQAAHAPQAEQLVTEQIMQPFMGNRDWAQLIAPRTELPEQESSTALAPGELAVGADECWLPEGGYSTMAFLSGLS